MTSTQQTLAELRELRLAGMAAQYELQLKQPNLQTLNFDDRFGMLVEHELSARHQRKLARNFTAAAMPEQAALEDIEYRPDRALEPGFITTLASCEWIRRHQNLIIHGATGVGKTWLACAFGYQACRLGLTVLFVGTTQLFERIATAAADGSLPGLRKALAAPALLIVDDLGHGEISQQGAQVLLDVVDRRMRTGSLLITSQYTADQWHPLFPGATVADAVLDRVVHQSHRLSIKGESMRKVLARKSMATP